MDHLYDREMPAHILHTMPISSVQSDTGIVAPSKQVFRRLAGSDHGPLPAPVRINLAADRQPTTAAGPATLYFSCDAFRHRHACMHARYHHRFGLAAGPSDPWRYCPMEPVARCMGSAAASPNKWSPRRRRRPRIGFCSHRPTPPPRQALFSHRRSGPCMFGWSAHDESPSSVTSHVRLEPARRPAAGVLLCRKQKAGASARPA